MFDRQFSNFPPWLTAASGSVGATLLSWPLLHSGGLLGVVVAALLLGAGPVLGYAWSTGSIRRNVLTLIMGAGGFLLGVGILSAVIWPIIVGSTSKQHTIGSLLTWSLFGQVVGIAAILALLPPVLGQNPAWIQLGFLLWGLTWGLCVSHGLGEKKNGAPFQSISESNVATSSPQVEMSPSSVKPARPATESGSASQGQAIQDKRDKATTPYSRETTVNLANSHEELRVQPETAEHEACGARKSTDNEDQRPQVQGAPSAEDVREALIAISFESWRMYKMLGRVLQKLEEQERRRFQNRVEWYIKQVQSSLEQAGLKMVNVEDHQYETGMAVTPLNLEDFEPGDKLAVEHMIEPIIMGETGLVRMGTVTLKKEEAS